MSGRIRLEAGDLVVELAPAVGGSVAAFTQAGAPVFRPTPPGYADVLHSACFPLVPYANRVRDGAFSFDGRNVQLSRNNLPQRHPLHGTGWRGAWSTAEAGGSSARLTLDWPGGDWPWPFRAEQLFEMDGHGLAIQLSVENRGDTPMPAGLGLHPYFPCPPGTVLDTSVTEVWTVDADLFPDGRAPATGRYDLRERMIHHAGLDNGYGGWGGEAVIRWPDGRAVRLSAPAPAEYFQVYAPDTADVLCAEPVTHANGALNASPSDGAELGLKVLQPGERLTLKSRFDPLGG